MKVIVFGATGPTGKLTVERALAQGHTVTAFARRRLDLEHPALTVRQGDATDYEQVREAIRGHDAVISALGAHPSNRRGVREVGTRHQIAAMQELGITRLVSLSSLGVGNSAHTLPWYMRWLVVPLYLRRAFADHEKQEALVASSGLAWTVARPPSLTDAPGTGTARHGHDLTQDISMSIPRADVATFLIQQLEDVAYLRRFAWVAS